MNLSLFLLLALSSCSAVLTAAADDQPQVVAGRLFGNFWFNRVVSRFCDYGTCTKSADCRLGQDCTTSPGTGLLCRGRARFRSCTGQAITFQPGKATVLENGMILSQGLTSKLIAETGKKVMYANGAESTNIFHSLPDAAAIIVNNSTGSYQYVSNSEASINGGVGTITFDKNGNVTKYEINQNGTIRNCGGGLTWWNTWITCEEWSGGHMWEIDTVKNTSRKTLLAQPYTAPWESAAYDNRNPAKPTFYVTADKRDGPLLRFTPGSEVVEKARATMDYSQLLHTASPNNKWEYLVLQPETNITGTYTWTTNVTIAERSAFAYYQSSEGLDIRKGLMYFTCKRDHWLFIVNLDTGRYDKSSTRSGAFEGQPDQISRLLEDVDEDILYFAEDTDTFAGVHGRNSKGKYFTIVQGDLGALDGETSGVTFSPGNQRMYVSFQTVGKIFEITRTDGRPFSGTSLDIKYHNDATNESPFFTLVPPA